MLKKLDYKTDYINHKNFKIESGKPWVATAPILNAFGEQSGTHTVYLPGSWSKVKVTNFILDTLGSAYLD